MLIGVPKEIKAQEFRVGMTPAGVREMTFSGHQVLVERSAGAGIGLTDALHAAAGATIVDSAERVFAETDLVVKVKEPQAQECRWLRPGQTLFTFLHLAADLKQARLLMDSGATCIAYETITSQQGGLPSARPHEPRSQADYQSKQARITWRSTRVATAPYWAVCRVLHLPRFWCSAAVLSAAARSASHWVWAQMSRSLTAPSLNSQSWTSDRGQLRTIYSTAESIEELAREADLIIGAVLIPGASAPKLISAEMLRLLKPGTVLVDVAIDQGGCFETSYPTTHADPTYVVDDVVHYCVANMPGAVASTATQALTNATLPFVARLASRGAERRSSLTSTSAQGLNVFEGQLTHQAVAEALDKPWRRPSEVLRQSQRLRSA